MGRRIPAEQYAVLGQPDPHMLGDVPLHGHDAQGHTLAITTSRGRSTSMVGGKLSGSLGSGTGDGPIPFPTSSLLHPWGSSIPHLKVNATEDRLPVPPQQARDPVLPAGGPIHRDSLLAGPP